MTDQARAHSLPRFDGRGSRRHADVALWRLRVRSALEIRSRPSLGQVRSTLFFVGFPRSGHSLIGALLDAHPRAIVAHELDAMGLLHKGFSWPQVARLIRWNAREFAAHGKWWNGFRYDVPGVAEAAEPPLLIGDKKGDWTARWSAVAPDLVHRVAASGAPHPRYLLVTRDPRNNIATMTLRRGGIYDRLRIEAAGAAGSADATLAEEQRRGKIAREVSDEMIDDYRALAEAVADMKARVPAEDWLDVSYERFAAAPREGLVRILRFVGLDADAAWIMACAGVVREGRSRSRDRLLWRDDQRASVRQITSRFDFLGYADD